MRIMIFIALFFSSLCVHAVDERLVVPGESRIVGDYYVTGKEVEVLGDVTGDLYVACQRLHVVGNIGGDVIGIAVDMRIDGDVGGSVRAASGKFELNGRVGRNLTVASGDMELRHTAVIGRNVIAAAGTCVIEAPVQGQSRVVSGNVRLSSELGESMKAYVAKMRLTPEAILKGDLYYRSSVDVEIDPGAKIYGTVTKEKSIFDKHRLTRTLNKILTGSMILARVMNIFYTFILGVIFLRLWPYKIDSGVRALNKHPWGSVTYGLLTAFGLPLVTLLLIFSLIGIPFGMMLAGLNLLGFYSAKIVPIFWFARRYGEKVRLKADGLWAYFIAVILYFMIIPIPWVGHLLALSALLCGLGAAAIATIEKEKGA